MYNRMNVPILVAFNLGCDLNLDTDSEGRQTLSTASLRRVDDEDEEGVVVVDDG